jgi:hypothetical protein
MSQKNNLDPAVSFLLLLVMALGDFAPGLSCCVVYFQGSRSSSLQEPNHLKSTGNPKPEKALVLS